MSLLPNRWGNSYYHLAWIFDTQTQCYLGPEDKMYPIDVMEEYVKDHTACESISKFGLDVLSDFLMRFALADFLIDSSVLSILRLYVMEEEKRS